MSVCPNCMKASDNLKNSFTGLERIHLMASAVSMARSIQDGQSQDKMVSSSVLTKLLLSFPPHQRDVFIAQFRKSAGLEITLNRCPHGVLEVV